MRWTRAPDARDRFESLFRDFDVDGNGKISQKEFRNHYQELLSLFFDENICDSEQLDALVEEPSSLRKGEELASTEEDKSEVMAAAAASAENMPPSKTGVVSPPETTLVRGQQV